MLKTIIAGVKTAIFDCNAGLEPVGLNPFRRQLRSSDHQNKIFNTAAQQTLIDDIFQGTPKNNRHRQSLANSQIAFLQQ